MKRALILGMAVMAVVLIAVPSFAFVVYEKPLDATAGPGWNSNAGGQQIADDFSLASGAGVTEVTWWGWFYLEQTVGDFDILFFNDDGFGMPETSDFYSVTVSGITGVDTGLTVSGYGNTIYEWGTSIPTALLPAGDLWISIRASATETDTYVWMHSVDSGGDVVVRFADTDAWELVGSYGGQRDEQAFKLEAVPEPATMLLLGFGLIGIGAARRRLK